MKIKNIIKLMVLVPLLASCDDVLEPTIENNQDLDSYLSVNGDAHGLLMVGYNRIPYPWGGGMNNTEVATDNAVSNYAVLSDNEPYDYIQKAANGTWTAANNPFDRWTSSREVMQYLNLFFERTNNVVWANDPERNEMFKNRLRSEAYALRALHMFHFLRAHCGLVGGELLGVPCLTHSETAGDNFNVPRASFDDCIAQIYSDLAEAKKNLTIDYGNVKNDADVPEPYKSRGVTAPSYNLVYGDICKGLISGRIVEAIEAQVALFAASPAYNLNNDIAKWEKAANVAAVLLDRIGGVAGLSPNGNTWYANIEEIDALGSGNCPAEIIWRRDINTNGTGGTDLEKLNYPSTLEGSGRINPTQNLVDAFPMANGYPITDSRSGYKAQDPYTNRDPRLGKYIVYDGSTVQNTVISTFNGTGATTDQLNDNGGKGTLTGYYLRKLIREDVVCKSTGSSARRHYTANIRYTEIFLAYAEAANEAWGPTGNGGHGYSAYDVIKAIRTRAGIVDDDYLEEVKADQAKMRELIRNERRIELCFEGHRFWDLRRWKANLNDPVKAMQIVNDGGTKTYTIVDVAGQDSRKFADYMYYCPIPETEVLKWSNLKQNDGWE